MNKKAKKAIVAGLLSAGILGTGAGAAYADTVYYNGDAVTWNHGVNLLRVSYSEVWSSQYENHATANNNHSGWKNPNEWDKASQFVRLGRGTAYWNCRG